MLRTLVLLYEPRLARQAVQNRRNIACLRRWYGVLLLSSTARLHLLHRLQIHATCDLLRLGRRRLRLYVGLGFTRYNDGKVLSEQRNELILLLLVERILHPGQQQRSVHHLLEKRHRRPRGPRFPYQPGCRFQRLQHLGQDRLVYLPRPLRRLQRRQLPQLGRSLLDL